MQHLKIAAIQSLQHWENKAANLAHFESSIQKVSKGIDLILLPEMFNTSFSMNTGLAEKMDGESVDWMLKQSLNHKSAIAATLMIEEEGQIYNRLLVVNEGELIAHYDKIHLFRMAKENEYFQAGTKNSIVELKGWKLQLQTCYDLRFPEGSRNSIQKNEVEFDALIYLANWPAKRSYAWSALLQARSIENQAFVVGLNRIGKDGNNHDYDGQSAAYDPWGNPLWKGEDKNEIGEITLDYHELLKIRKSFNTLLDIKNQ